MGACADAAAHHRPGPGGGAALHRPHDERRGGRCLGLLQPRWCRPTALEDEALALARRIAAGPTFAHMMTKTQLNQEWTMGLDQAIEAEAQAQAICMQTQDFRARLSMPSSPRTSRCSRATDGRPTASSTGRSSSDAPPRAGRWTPRRLGCATNLRTVDHARHRRGLPRAGGDARPRRLAGSARPSTPTTARSNARRAQPLPDPRDAGAPRRARRFRLRHAGARHRRDLAVRHDGAAATLAAARRARARPSPPSR